MRRGPVPVSVPLAIGLTALATAAVLAAMHEQPAPDASPLRARLGAAAWVLLRAPVDAALGVGALAVAAKLAARPFGDGAAGAARMLACVALFHLTLRLGLHPALAWLGACAAYVVSVGVSFHPRPREWLHIVAAHTVLWGVLQLVVWGVQRLGA